MNIGRIPQAKQGIMSFKAEYRYIPPHVKKNAIPTDLQTRLNKTLDIIKEKASLLPEEQLIMVTVQPNRMNLRASEVELMQPFTEFPGCYPRGVHPNNVSVPLERVENLISYLPDTIFYK